MPNLSPTQESVLQELAGVAEEIRDCVPPNTTAFTHAHQLHSWLSPVSSHPATPGEIDRNVKLLRADLEALTAPGSSVSAGVAIQRFQVSELLARLDGAYGRAVQAFKGS